MNKTARIIHTNEFAIHLALHSAAVFWRYMFYYEIPENKINTLQKNIVSGKGVLNPEDIEEFTQNHLGNDAVTWMRNYFISTAEPRATLQQSILMAAVRPTVAPKANPEMTQALCNALDDKTLMALKRFDDLLLKQSLETDHPNDIDFIKMSKTLINPVHPIQRLIDSLYITILGPVIESLPKGYL